MTTTYAAMTPIPTDATTVTQRIRGMKSEITIYHPVYLQFEFAVLDCSTLDATESRFVYAASSIYLR